MFKLEDVPPQRPTEWRQVDCVVPPTPSADDQVKPKRLSFIMALRDHFKRPGQTTIAFIHEVKHLTHAEKMELHAMMVESGVDVDLPLSAAYHS